MPEVPTSAMSAFLAAFTRALQVDQHAALVLDLVAWHAAKAPFVFRAAQQQLILSDALDKGRLTRSESLPSVSRRVRAFVEGRQFNR